MENNKVSVNAAAVCALCRLRIFVSNDPPLPFSLTHLPVQVWGYKHTTSSYIVVVFLLSTVELWVVGNTMLSLMVAIHKQ